MTAPIGERTVRLGEAFEQLNEQLDELAVRLGEADANTQSGQALQNLATETEQKLAGVDYLIHTAGGDGYGEDATVTVKGLGAGSYARMEDRVDDHRASRDGPGQAPGGRRKVFAASGLVDAPFADIPDVDDADVTESQRFEAALAALSDDSLPVGVEKWIEGLVSTESSVEGNFEPLSARLAASSKD
ncbi:hypothetical protein VB779_08690 [Haloarculaceae archaeon H-GB11]|nr:hypothetical protein [Haloarculaceae archaeon H-GB11]